MRSSVSAVLLLGLLLGLLGLGPCRAAEAGDGPSRLTYTLEPLLSAGVLRLGVGLSFVGDASGTTRLHLPGRFAGQGRLYEGVEGLEAVSPGAAVVDTAEPDVKRVTFPPGGAVSLHYWLAGDEAARASRRGGYFRPALLPGWFALIGKTFWVYPSQYAPTLTAALHWKMPAGWTLCGSLGAGGQDQEFTGTLEQFLETVYVGGDFRVRTADVDGQKVTVAVRGKWKFSDGELADTAARVLRAERDFWQDHDFPYYLVALIPTEGADGGGNDAGGVELTRAVALYQPAGRALDFGLKYVLAHEAFHTWNADQMQAGGDTPLYWFSEGFTDYYSRRLLLQAGLISLDEYARDFNRIVREYWLSPARNARGAEASRSFYAGDAAARLPYEQGCLLAAHWEAALREATGDKRCLGDALRDLRRASLGGADLDAARVAEAVRRYAPLDAAGEVERGVAGGLTVTPDPHGLGPGFALRVSKIAPFELGFDAAATFKRQTVTGVVPGSRAAGAGLRDGQPVVSCLPFTMGDSEQRIVLTIREGDNTRAIEFSPCGEGVSVPQYARDRGVSEAACRAWFGNPAAPAGR